MFFNSLRLTWQMSLWADSPVLLRTMAWLDTPTETSLLAQLQPQQLEFGLASVKNSPESKNTTSPMNPHFRILAFGTPSNRQFAFHGTGRWYAPPFARVRG